LNLSMSDARKARKQSEMALLRGVMLQTAAQTAELLQSFRGLAGNVVPALSAHAIYHDTPPAIEVTGAGAFFQPKFQRTQSAVKRSATLAMAPLLVPKKAKRMKLPVIVAPPTVAAPLVAPPVVMVAAPVVEQLVAPQVAPQVLPNGFQPNGWPLAQDVQVLDAYYGFHGPLLWPDGLSLEVLTPTIRAQLVGHIWLHRVAAGGGVDVLAAAAMNTATELVISLLYDRLPFFLWAISYR
jgi:hypothetical protein